MHKVKVTQVEHVNIWSQFFVHAVDKDLPKSVAGSSFCMQVLILLT